MTRIVLVALVACGITVQKESKKSEPSIAVVGAGMAGLSAARRLTELGLTNFDIYEGATRIGGRIHSIPYENGYLQMGAQFINGKDNPIYKIAEKLNVVESILPDTAQFSRADFLFGNQTIDWTDIELFKNFAEPLYDKYRTMVKNYDLLSRIYTIKTLFMEEYNNFLKLNNIVGEQRRVMDAMIRPFKTFWEFEWGGDWKDLSPRVLAEFNQMSSEGDSFTTGPIGFTAIMNYMGDGVNMKHYRFNNTITNIEYGGDGVYLTSQQEGKISKRYDYVIVTASLGHLKKFHHKLFNPPLPRQKVEAIEKIGFGGNCKIFFRWETPFWKNGTDYIAPLPVEGQARETIDPFEMEMNTLEVVGWAPNTLMAFIAGAGHELMDNMEDDELSERITRLIRDMMNDQTIPPPSRIIRTKLTKNDLLLGSYSYLSQAQAQAGISHSRLGIPIKVDGKPRVLFAGEATHHRLFQTTVGAYMSGRREADRVWKTYAPPMDLRKATLKFDADKNECDSSCHASMLINHANLSY